MESGPIHLRYRRRYTYVTVEQWLGRLETPRRGGFHAEPAQILLRRRKVREALAYLRETDGRPTHRKARRGVITALQHLAFALKRASMVRGSKPQRDAVREALVAFEAANVASRKLARPGRPPAPPLGMGEWNAVYAALTACSRAFGDTSRADRTWRTFVEDQPRALRVLLAAYEEAAKGVDDPYPADDRVAELKHVLPALYFAPKRGMPRDVPTEERARIHRLWERGTAGATSFGPRSATDEVIARLAGVSPGQVRKVEKARVVYEPVPPRHGGEYGTVEDPWVLQRLTAEEKRRPGAGADS